MFFSSHKPDWLYAAMPVLYLVAGLAVLALLRNPIGSASGLLMVAAAVAIVVARVRYRQRQAEASFSRLSSIIAPPSRLAATTEMVRAVMPPRLGHRDIDRQHRGLASRAATLRVSFAHNDDLPDIEQLLHELVDAVEAHVDAEIVAMRGLGVTRDPAQVLADRERLAQARRELDDYGSGALTLEQAIDRLTGALVAGHLGSAHQPLPRMEDALRQLRDAAT